MVDVSSGGRHVWFDLMTPNPEKAQAFYPKVTGWGTTAWDGPMPYTMWTAGGVPVGGVMKQPPSVNAPPHWLGYVSTPNADATAAQAASLGGSVMVPPTDIPTVGRYAVLRDPQGATFAAFTPEGSSAGQDGAAAEQAFSWHELMTTDYAAALDFYQALFGWTRMDQHDMGPMGIYQLFGRGDQMVGGMFNKPAEVPSPNWLHYVRVESADEAAERVKANGGTILNGPMEVPGGDRIAQCMDPLGAAFAVHSRA
jgi:predicted enzyme related to lactoylglutathione lyase